MQLILCGTEDISLKFTIYHTICMRPFISKCYWLIYSTAVQYFHIDWVNGWFLRNGLHFKMVKFLFDMNRVKNLVIKQKCIRFSVVFYLIEYFAVYKYVENEILYVLLYFANFYKYEYFWLYFIQILTWKYLVNFQLNSTLILFFLFYLSLRFIDRCCQLPKLCYCESRSWTT